MDSQPDPAQLLAAWRAGNRKALDALFSLVHDDLRLRAHRLFQGQPAEQTLSTKGLVQASYLALIRSGDLALPDRAHFLALAAHALRLVLVSYARGHAAEQRGGSVRPLELNEELVLSDERVQRLPALDEALGRLALVSERLSKTVELRFFGGLTIEETAAALDVAASTVELDWQKARAWLRDNPERH
jgi:RNA polymerase sigma-70 factor (ECF subfamily)